MQDDELADGSDFIALTLSENGTIAFAYDTGDGVQQVQTLRPYNDGLWHSVTATRLTVDDLTFVSLDTEDESVSATFFLVCLCPISSRKPNTTHALSAAIPPLQA